MNKKASSYKYPIGDFLSGFSEDENNPCDYELECQRMVVRGVQYLDENPKLFESISNNKIGAFDPNMKPMIDFMCKNEDNLQDDMGQTGAMVSHTVKHAYHAKKMGWDKYIFKITKKDENNE